jgi:hypothetical protein
MKNNLINYKLPLLTIIYSVICIILIRESMNFNLIPYNSSKKIILGAIVAPSFNTNIPSNELATTKKILPHSNNVTTLSRGYKETLEKGPTKVSGSPNNEDELFALNEVYQIDSYTAKKSIALSTATPSTESQIINAHLPDYIMYKAVNVSNLKDFLKSRNSLLAEEPYLSTILAVSKDFNLNPLVMFAITGQEQSFVPKSSENAYEIANNPYNVFNSWKKYNTSIEDTSNIAARTIVNLSKNRPTEIDVFTWVNRKYSEDKEWSKAIRSIFKQLEDTVSYCK